MDENDLGNIGNARSPEQIAHMEATVGQGKCPFCDGIGFDPEKNVVLWSGKFFRCWKNPFPYHGHGSHFVIASLQHWTSIDDISWDAWGEWGLLNQWLISELELPGGGIVMRFGDNSYNAGTLAHLHSHIQVPDKTGPCFAVFYKDPTMIDFIGNIGKSEG